MENQKTGYIPVYRSILKQSWAKDVYLRTLWENLLLNAARKPYKANFKGHEAVYDENSSAAPFAEIIVTKNRFGSLGTVYQRFCNGHFVACDQDEARQICTASNAPAARGRRYAQGADV